MVATPQLATQIKSEEGAHADSAGQARGCHSVGGSRTVFEGLAFRTFGSEIRVTNTCGRLQC